MCVKLHVTRCPSPS
uniref:Uncharacterized protein n=1 Tax=Anguilla anguilla TaxID=7936 RepID=A0A0E9R8Y4_ANGAN